jgi:hypothetical protein
VPHSKLGRIVVAGESGDLWREIGGAVGSQDPEPFFDQFVVHELAHLYHESVPFRFPRLWLEELWVNLAMWTCAAEMEPHVLPAVERFAAGLAALPVERRSLAEFDRWYDSLEDANFGWFEARFVLTAARTYAAHGAGALVSLWDRFCAGDERVLGQLPAETAALIRAWS